jgi:dTDP-4-dehydrorhamnose reductase
VQEEAENRIFQAELGFRAGRQNFISKLTEWAEKSEYLKISCDEFSVPTYTDT